MANFFTDNPDLQFYFEKGIDWAPLVTLTEYGFQSPGGFSNTNDAVQFYRDVTTMVGEFVADEVVPVVSVVERKGVGLQNGEAVVPPELDQLFASIAGLELHGMALPRELGGMNCPMLLYYLHSEMFARADVSIMAHHGFHGGIAMALLLYSILEGTTHYDRSSHQITSTRFHNEIQRILRGQAWGCMDITEPNAGSDMAALRTVGEQDDAGNWFVTGEKVFITSGHGQYHLVVARTEKAQSSADPMAGLRGLSLFLVPAYEEGADGERRRIVSIERVEEKLGHHGSVTTGLLFDRAPAQLIGQRGEGFKHMLTLMNNARLAVGFESIGLAESAYRMARQYAAERKSMGKTIDQHELIADYLDEMATDVQGLRALAMHGAFHEEMAQKLRIRLQLDPPDDSVARVRLRKQATEHKAIARRATPLLKYLAAEKAVEIARRAIQIHGGNGYIVDYGVEKLLRDAMVMPIYEGTSQIQSLMAMKDCFSSLLRNPQAFAARTAQAHWRGISARDPLERRVARIQQLSLGAQQHLLRKTATDKLKRLSDQPLSQWSKALRNSWNPKRDFAFALLHAERLTRILADELICEVLLHQSRQHPERREVLERYLERAEPRTRSLHDEILTRGERLLSSLHPDKPALSPRAAG